MKDVHITWPPELSPAESAVLYLLKRVRHDADLRWHVLGTEAFALLCAAEAARTGKSAEEVEALYATPVDGELPQLVRCRRAIRKAIDALCDERDQRALPRKWMADVIDELERHT
jgi:hypothetical protein